MVRNLFQACAGMMIVIWAMAVGASEKFMSHIPAWPLPQASMRLLDGAAVKYVDAEKGNDQNAGTEAKPWRTLAYAAQRLVPGDTLCLRAGIYFEHVSANLVGTADKPITIRAYPGELVTLDGGIRDFQANPQTAWEPDPHGVAGEFRSTSTFPDVETTHGELRVSVMGRFVDSMLPLHGYWHHPDLQSDNPYWTLSGKAKVKVVEHVYCGPGLWYDTESDRIHVRLAHTKLPGLGENNYRGETDPRKLPLVVATFAAGPVLTLTDSRYVRLQDLVFRGARADTLSLDGGANLEIDGCTVYGGGACLRASGVHGLRMCHTACRGLAAPWTFRGSLKYRSIESRIIRTGGWDPSGNDGRDYEFANCEFTDSVDGVFIGNIRRVYLHHSLIENVSDDAIFVTSNTGFDGRTQGGGHVIAFNRFARNLTCFAFGVGHGRQRTIDAESATKLPPTKQLGGGLFIDHNVFDFRGPVMYRWPSGPDDVQEIDSLGRFAGDHGSPGWEPMEITQNTLLTGNPPRYEYATDGFATAMRQGTRRRLFNNVIVQKNGLPGTLLPAGDLDYAADGNLLWAAVDGPTTLTLPPAKLARDQVPPKPEWAQHDKYADPKFVDYNVDWKQPVDLRLQPDSPAVNAGVNFTSTGLPANLKMPVDAGSPDIGAIPFGSELPRIGCYGRFDVCGNSTTPDVTLKAVAWLLPPVPDTELPRRYGKPVAIVTGYPAFDEPLVAFALRSRGIPVVTWERQWLDTSHYSKYGAVVVDGSFTRGKILPDRYTDDDLPILKKYLEDGGILWLLRERQDLFADPQPRKFLNELVDSAANDRTLEFQIRLPQHSWVKGLDGDSLDWLAKNARPLSMSRGELVIGSKQTNAVLGRIPVGAGQIIYLGFSPAASLPNGRVKSTVDDERRFSQQMQVLTNVVDTLFSSP